VSGTDYVFYPVTGDGLSSATAYTWNTGQINFNTGSYWAQVASFETLTLGTSPTTGVVPTDGANVGIIAGAIDPFVLGLYSPNVSAGDPYFNFPSNGAFSVDVLLNSGSVQVGNLLLAGFNQYANVIESAPTQYPTLDVEGATLTVTGNILDTATVTFPPISTPIGTISSATANGGGTIDLGHGATVNLDGSVPSDITFNFNDASSNVLEISGDSTITPNAFTGTITNMVSGDAVVLPNVPFVFEGVTTTGSYDVATGVLTITAGDPVTFTLDIPGLQTTSGPVSLTQSGGGIEIQPACYLQGTLILTDRGEVLVETLRVGDAVITHSGEAKPIKWIGRRSYEGAFAAANPDLAPILIRAGALADGIPRRDLYVSREHALYLDRVLIPAHHLVNGTSILATRDINPLRYYHIELEAHDVIYAEGAAAETFIDCDSRGIFHNAAEFASLYPDAARTAPRFCARVFERGKKLAAINARLAARAAHLGLAPSGSGPLEGHIDHADQAGISGWAFCRANPEAPVQLEILADGKVIAAVPADRRRADLVAASIGDGRHGFELAFTRPLDPFCRHTIGVRRAVDRRPLGQPVVIEPAHRLDPPARTAFAALLRQATQRVQTAADAEALLALLSGEAEQARRARLRLLRREGPHMPHRGAGNAPARRALVIDAAWPRPDHDAGSQAIVSHMQSLLRLRWHVSFTATASLGENAEAKARLEALGITCHALPSGSVEELLRESADQYQLVYLHRLAVASAYAGLVRQYQTRARLVYSVADLHHLRLARQAAVEARPELERHAVFVRRQELLAAHQADAVITHSPAEAALLAREAPGLPVTVVPWSVRAWGGQPLPWEEREGVALVANFRHEPNSDGLLWLFREVMPLVWAQAPVVLSVAGVELPSGIARALSHPLLRVFGYLRDLRPLLAGSRLAVAPLRYGAGIKGKVLDAWAAGLPCAMTPVAAEGFTLDTTLAATVAGDVEGLARLILDLHADAARNAAAARAGRAALRLGFSHRAVDAALAAVVSPEKPVPVGGRSAVVPEGAALRIA
jgi:glycosyltransferase involved in cell wall biosynthesis